MIAEQKSFYQRTCQLSKCPIEVDYFLCKDAKEFLHKHLDLWLWQRLLGKIKQESKIDWNDTSLKLLHTLQKIACAIIDFIAALEDEVVEVWNAPRAVLNSHYVITLARIVERPDGR